MVAGDMHVLLKWLFVLLQSGKWFQGSRNEREAQGRRGIGKLGHLLKSMMQVKNLPQLSHNTSIQGCIWGTLTSSR